MLTSRYNEALPINRLRGAMHRLFEEVLEDSASSHSGHSQAATFPALNVWEDTSSVFVEAELPGLTLEDIEVLVTADELTVKGNRQGVMSEKQVYHRQERGTGAFSRTLRLPLSLSTDKVSATLRDGVLLVTIPKAEDVRPRKVEVKTLPA